MELTYKIFINYIDLCAFVNKKNITKEQIQHIKFYPDSSFACTLFYWTLKEERRLQNSGEAVIDSLY